VKLSGVSPAEAGEQNTATAGDISSKSQSEPRRHPVLNSQFLHTKASVIICVHIGSMR
jgi:hypothetical protein